MVAFALGCGPRDDAPDASADDAADASDRRRAAGADAGGGEDAGLGGAGPSDVYPAAHPDAPQVRSRGGPVLARPRVVAITWDVDPWQAEIDRFASALAASRYWADATAEYGVGALAIGEAVHLRDAPPASLDDDAAQAIVARAAGATIDADALFVVLTPPGVDVRADRWGASCVDFAGYHWETSGDTGGAPDAGGADAAIDAGHARRPYAVVPRCASWMDLRGLDALTTTTAHEIVEAATDPFPASAPAFHDVDPDHAVWSLYPASEVADMCGAAGSAPARPSDLGYAVPRIWSNAAARAQHDPCGGDGAYFNAAPVLRDEVPIALGGGHAQTKGVRVALGETAVVEVDLFSDAPTTGAWTVTAVDVHATTTGLRPLLDLQLDRAQGQNGEKLQLSITALRTGPSGGAELMLVSTLRGVSHAWLGFVAN